MAIRIRCWKPKCKGVPLSLNDGAARLAERMGRLHYKCDKCGTRWSITPKDYNAQLDRGVRRRTVSRLR